MVVTLPGETFTSHSGNSGTVTAQTANTPFNLTLTAADQFLNTVTSYTGANVSMRSLGAQTLTATNQTQGGITANTSSSFTVNTATLGLAGITGDKTYDATTNATFIGTATLVGVLSSDVVNVSGTAAGTFANRFVGNLKTVTLIGLTLGGADASYYALPATTTANIMPLTLGLSGLNGNKTYDSSTTATFTGTASLINTLAADVVTVSGTPTGTFANKNVGNFKTVTLIGLSLGGADGGNYALPTTVTANITPLSLGVAGLNGGRIYDATTNATFTGTASLIGILSSDAVNVSGAVTGTFDNKNVGNFKTVTLVTMALGGTDGGNYALPATLTASITPRTLGVAGLDGNKIYDATINATFTGTASLVGILSADAVTVSGTAFRHIRQQERRQPEDGESRQPDARRRRRGQLRAARHSDRQYHREGADGQRHCRGKQDIRRQHYRCADNVIRRAGGSDRRRQRHADR
jgi:trimeric autotransporter adhesin